MPKLRFQGTRNSWRPPAPWPVRRAGASTPVQLPDFVRNVGCSWTGVRRTHPLIVVGSSGLRLCSAVPMALYRRPGAHHPERPSTGAGTPSLPVLDTRSVGLLVIRPLRYVAYRDEVQAATRACSGAHLILIFCLADHAGGGARRARYATSIAPSAGRAPGSSRSASNASTTGSPGSDPCARTRCRS